MMYMTQYIHRCENCEHEFTHGGSCPKCASPVYRVVEIPSAAFCKQYGHHYKAASIRESILPNRLYATCTRCWTKLRGEDVCREQGHHWLRTIQDVVPNSMQRVERKGQIIFTHDKTEKCMLCRVIVKTSVVNTVKPSLKE